LFGTFSSSEFGFELTVPEDLERNGWGIIHARDATVSHTFTPPDTSSWQPIAVVVPPGSLFPTLSPIFVDVFNVKDPSISAIALADKKAERVADRVLSRQTITAGSLDLAQVVHGSGDDVNYETFAVGNGFGYALLAQGAPDTSRTATSFFVDSIADGRIVSSLRLMPPQ
jgi:hypothetical protein